MHARRVKRMSLPQQVQNLYSLLLCYHLGEVHRWHSLAAMPLFLPAHPRDRREILVEAGKHQFHKVRLQTRHSPD